MEVLYDLLEPWFPHPQNVVVVRVKDGAYQETHTHWEDGRGQRRWKLLLLLKTPLTIKPVAQTSGELTQVAASKTVAARVSGGQWAPTQPT